MVSAVVVDASFNRAVQEIEWSFAVAVVAAPLLSRPLKCHAHHSLSQKFFCPSSDFLLNNQPIELIARPPNEMGEIIWEFQDALTEYFVFPEQTRRSFLLVCKLNLECFVSLRGLVSGPFDQMTK